METAKDSTLEITHQYLNPAGTAEAILEEEQIRRCLWESFSQHRL